ncbi:hypothetical protein JRO89_XS12G0233100 [Xanthoceras sorbifolium]|uniref:Uncharacterized protein n=1 Tax=Xanthoceras sorbifolium TaxID=99658 RepID=A0ABQ8HDG7_9ROSI|nr:hypothetical protein JRO89_XS12G0233100 [Xanthoceras sorbifolium]
MEITGRRILRKSIHTFLKYFHYFTTTPALLLLPFSASALLAEALLTPSSSYLSLTMFVLCLLSLLFTLFSFLVAKSSIIQALNHHKPSPFRPHFSSLVLITTINMVCFFVFVFGLNFLRSSSSSSSMFLVLARIVLCAFSANMLVISNLALVVVAVEDCKWFAAIYKACLLRKGKHSMALLVAALPTNLGVAAIEGLFRFRVLQVYQQSLGRYSASIALEGMLIAYLYSLLVVLDTIACCLFYKNCESSLLANQSDRSCCDIENVQEKPESLEVLP